MRKWKKWVSLLLALILMLSILGCDTVAPKPTESGATPSQSTTSVPPSSEPTTVPASGATDPTEELEFHVQFLPEKVENPEELPVLKWVVLTQYYHGGIYQTRTEDAARDVNQMLSDLDMPYRVQFVLLSLKTRLSFWQWFEDPQLFQFAEPYLSEADLIWGKMDSETLVRYLSPITEYVTGDAAPSLKNAVLHPLEWEDTRVGGEIYGYSTDRNTVSSSGWEIDPALLTKCGLTVDDFRRNFWEMDDVFAQIYKKLGNEPFLNGYSGTIQATYYDGRVIYLPNYIGERLDMHTAIGSCFIVDYSSGTPKVVNYLETDFVQNMQKAFIRYADAGYIKDYRTRPKPEEIDNLVDYGPTVGDEPYVDTSHYGTLKIPVRPAVASTSVSPHVSGIAAVSQHKDEAVSLLNLIAENEEFRMLLMHGKEGRDYHIVDGFFVPAQTEDRASYSLDILTPYAYYSGLYTDDKTSDAQNAGTISRPVVYEGKTALQTYRHMMDNVDIIACPVTFDCSAFQEDFAKLDEIFHEYFPSLTSNQNIGEKGDRNYRFRMTEALYRQMLQQIRDAGSEKIIAELQRQLDEWLAKNPDWLARYG